MSDLVPIRRALLSVSDKNGPCRFAAALSQGHSASELISTGGTAKFCAIWACSVTERVAGDRLPRDDGRRVKRCTRRSTAGCWRWRDQREHLRRMKDSDIQPIDLVCINLYPFEATINKPGVTF